MYVGQEDIQNNATGNINYTGNRATKDFSESVSDAWRSTRFSGVFTSEQNNLHEEFQNYIEEIEETTGEKLNNPYQHGDVEFYMNGLKSTNPLGMIEVIKNSYDKFSGKNIRNFYKELDKVKAKHPELKYRDLEDIRKGIKKRGENLRAEINDGRETNGWGEFVGSAAAIMSDPVNVTTTLLTMGSGSLIQNSLRAAIGKAVLREAAVNMVSEAVVQAKVAPYKQELGEDYNLIDAAENVGMAGIGASVFTAAFMGTGSLLKATIKKVDNLKTKGLKLKPSEESLVELAKEKILLDDYLDQTNKLGNDEFSKQLHKDLLLSRQQRMQSETKVLGEMYDDIIKNPKNPDGLQFLEIGESELSPSVMDRGELVKAGVGNSKRGLGLIKIIWKHGEKSTDPIKVTKEDIINFPKIFREFTPYIDGPSNEYRIWSIKRSDGNQLLYIDKLFDRDGARHVVSIHAIKDDVSQEYGGILSKKRSSSIPEQRLSTPDQDTAQGTYHRAFESEEINHNITPDPEKVNKSVDDANYPKMEEIENLLKEEDRLIPLREIDGEVEALSAREVVEQIKKEDSWIEHINSCISEYGK